MDKVKSAINSIKTYVPLYLVLIVCLISVLKSLFGIKETDNTPQEIIASIAESMMMGISLSMLFRMQAITDAKKSTEFQSSLTLLATEIKNVESKQDKVPAFCNYKNEMDLISAKREHLSSQDLSYQKYVEGYYNDPSVYDSLSKKKRKVLEETQRIRISTITPKELLSNVGSKKTYTTSRWRKPKSRFGSSTGNYMNSALAKDLISKFILGILFGYYTLKPLINADSKGLILWTLFSLVIYLITAFVGYLSMYNKMIDEYRAEHIIQKTNLLKEFMVICKERPELLDKYEYIDKKEEM